MSNVQAQLINDLRKIGAVNIERVESIGDNKELYRYSKDGIPMSAVFLCTGSSYICIGANLREKEDSLVEHMKNII